MTFDSNQGGLLAPTREWLEELVKLAQDWLAADDTLKQFDSVPSESMDEDPAQTVEKFPVVIHGVMVSRDEVREMLVKRRAAAAILLENKGVCIGRRERAA